MESTVRTWTPRPARSLSEELAIAARHEHRIILVIPTADVHGELGEVVGEEGGLLRVEFSNEQAQRMLRQMMREDA